MTKHLPSALEPTHVLQAVKSYKQCQVKEKLLCGLGLLLLLSQLIYIIYN